MASFFKVPSAEPSPDVSRRTSLDIELNSVNRDVQTQQDEQAAIKTPYNAEADLEAYDIPLLDKGNGSNGERRHSSRSSHMINRNPSRNSAQVGLGSLTASTYTLKRYILRSVLNTVGPCLVIAFYLFIVFVYLLRPSVNGVIPNFPIDAKGIFFAWLILSIFALDWAKSGLAGFEAHTLMKRALAPATAMQLMWHNDRAWGSVSGWWKAFVTLYEHVSDIRSSRKGFNKVSKMPAGIWWYLSLSSFTFYAAIPLAGLSMDPKDALRISDRQILISGPNQTTFDDRSSNGVVEQANSRWRQGNPTTPNGGTILYGPKGTGSVPSSTHYEDTIQEIYRDDLDHNPTAKTGPISFFSGPEVSERAHGRAWGLLTNLTCSIANPTDLELLQVSAIDNWPSIWGAPASSAYYANHSDGPLYSGLRPTLFYSDQSFGVSYKYLIAVNRAIDGGSDYSNTTASSTPPVNSSLELVMWQSYVPGFTPDPTFLNLSSYPSVVSSISMADNTTYLGYAIRCSVNSTVGFADLDAPSGTYSNFSSQLAISDVFSGLANTNSMNGAPGILAVESIVYASFSTAILRQAHIDPTCQPNGSLTCSPWYGANVATRGIPSLIMQQNKLTNQYPTLGPERLKLAVYKLFGEAAIAMMAAGPGSSWTGELLGLDRANDLVPGRVPWQVVLILLAMWTVITVVPNCWVLMKKRWAATLDGFELFRLGAEWTHAVWKFEGSEFRECDVLAEVPGMVGDMEPESLKGFVGLSKSVAGGKTRVYVHDREALWANS